MRKNRGVEITAAGIVAAVVIACGEAGVSGGGAMMRDAGEWLVDAGTSMGGAGADDSGAGGAGADGGLLDDAGSMLADAGQMLADAGRMLADAGEGGEAGGGGVFDDAAVAQDCGSCTAGQRQMVVTADQDLAQLRSGTVENAGWTVNRSVTVHGPNCDIDVESRLATSKLADGPLVLTDVFADSSGFAPVLYTVPQGDDCYDVGPNTPLYRSCSGPVDALAVPMLVRPAASRTILPTALGMLVGARIRIDDDESLCAIGGTSQVFDTSQSDPGGATLMWSGFVPYE